MPQSGRTVSHPARSIDHAVCAPAFAGRRSRWNEAAPPHPPEPHALAVREPSNRDRFQSNDASKDRISADVVLGPQRSSHGSAIFGPIIAIFARVRGDNFYDASTRDSIKLLFVAPVHRGRVRGGPSCPGGKPPSTGLVMGRILSRLAWRLWLARQRLFGRGLPFSPH
jgi:hypothetical protein